MSKMAERVKKYYDAGLYTKEIVHKFAEKNAITADEYKEITGEDYVA